MSTYSFMDVAATITGPGVLVDFGYGSGAAEEGITISMAGDKSSMTIGADGKGMHNLHADKSGTITVRLLRTSPKNQQLQAAYDLQTAIPSSHGKNVIVVSMPRVGELHTARNVAFKKRPDYNYAKDGKFIEWVFDAIEIDGVAGVY